jgi:hypothetical protein
MRHILRRVATLALIAVAACAHNKNDVDEELMPRPDPIPVHVKNENFLDMNVFVVASGVSRRLGTVSGNGAGDFKVDWSVANGQSISITATPIGGRGAATSGSLNVGVGQMIDFTIAAQLRQSVATVHDPD